MVASVLNALDAEDHNYVLMFSYSTFLLVMMTSSVNF